MNRRLVLDLTKCEGCEECTVDCGYFYGQHGGEKNQGIQSLKEHATMAIVCRRCEHPCCVKSCPYDALEKQPDGSVKRFNLRCVSCKLCTQACPFGTIYPEMVGFYVTPCDYCIDATTGQPPCVGGCVKEAISFRDVDTSEHNMHLLDEHLAVIAPQWEKEKV